MYYIVLLELTTDRARPFVFVVIVVARKVEKEMADKVGQAEETKRRLNRSRKKLERKLVSLR